MVVLFNQEPCWTAPLLLSDCMLGQGPMLPKKLVVVLAAKKVVVLAAKRPVRCLGQASVKSK